MKLSAQEKISDSETKERIKQLARLDIIEYEKIRTQEAKNLGISRISVLDKEVEAVRKSLKTPNPSNEMFPIIEPFTEKVNGEMLLDEICTTIRRFIICDNETVHATALWIIFTWLIDIMKVAPIATITAPEMQCGKTQLLSLIGRLAHRPLLASNITPAAIFRVIEAHKPTLLIDEADSFLREKEELRGIINSGHTRQSAYVIRTVGEEHEAMQFSTWGAKVICGIGKPSATILDRSIILELRRKLPHEKIERLRHAEEDTFMTLQKKIMRFTNDAKDEMQKLRPSLPESLSDREQDNWEPLLMIADYIGGKWASIARETAINISNTKDKTESKSAGVLLLTDIQDVFSSSSYKIKITTEELLNTLHEMEDRPWPEWHKGQPITARKIATLLKPYGITPKKMRMGSLTIRGYEKNQFEDAFSRYTEGTTEQDSIYPALKQNVSGTITAPVPDQEQTNTLKNKDCSTVPSQEDIIEW